MYGLGISAFNHDSAAILTKDGAIVCALEEERFSRIKHDGAFPFGAIKQCLAMEQITIDDLSYIAYYEKPLLRFERIISSAVAYFPKTYQFFSRSMKIWLGDKIKVEHIIKNTLKFSGPIHFNYHHESHAACAYFTSPFSESAVVTIDGVGEYTTTALWHAKENTLTCLGEIQFPHSIGLLYSIFTAHLGFRVNSDEYKMMGLAAYGSPTKTRDIEKLITQSEDGSFALDTSFFSYEYSREASVTKKFQKLFGPRRKPEEPILQSHKDLAASIQKVTEDLSFDILREVHARTESRNICISGGVALNAVANGKVLERTPFEHAYIYGVAGDNGAALGTSLFTHHITLGNKKTNHAPSNLNLGTQHTPKYIEQLLEKEPELTYTKYNSFQQLIEVAAKLLAAQQIGGWFVGKMEFGPRALGQRSMLADPSNTAMKKAVNAIKQRENFRPFGLSILEEHIPSFFTAPKNHTHVPHMNTCYVVTSDKQNTLGAVVHADNTVRIQSVDTSQNTYHQLLEKFYEYTGVPGLLNTSLNIQGEPIAESPEQAIALFKNEPLDFLVLETYLIHKK